MSPFLYPRTASAKSRGPSVALPFDKLRASTRGVLKTRKLLMVSEVVWVTVGELVSQGVECAVHCAVNSHTVPWNFGGHLTDSFAAPPRGRLEVG